MIDPYQRWNDEMFPETKFLFPLFEEMKSTLNLTHLSPFPQCKQFMRVQCERTNQLITNMNMGLPLFQDTGFSDRKFVIGYGFQDIYAFVRDNPTAYLIFIQPCEFDIMSPSIHMTRYEYHLLRSFTEFLGLKEPVEMHRYRCNVYTMTNVTMDDKIYRSMSRFGKE